MFTPQRAAGTVVLVTLSWTNTWQRGQPTVLTDPGPLVRPRDVGGTVAWQDLRWRGLLQEVAPDVAITGNLPVTAAIRASALADIAPLRTVVAGLAAAWVWGAAEAPRVLDVVYPRGAHRPGNDPRRRSRQATLLHCEVEELAGVRVTSPLRTALDVATGAHPAEARRTIARLADGCGLDLADAARSLELRLRWPGRDRARVILAEAEAADARGPLPRAPHRRSP